MVAPQKFSRDVSGAIAPLFALIFIPILALALTAYDYNHAMGVKAHLQHAVDNAANAAVQRLDGPVGDLKGMVGAFLKANLSKNYQHYPFTMTATSSSITVMMHERVPTTLLALAGVPYIEINVGSTVQAPKLPALKMTMATFRWRNPSAPQKGLEIIAQLRPMKSARPSANCAP